MKLNKTNQHTLILKMQKFMIISRTLMTKNCPAIVTFSKRLHIKMMTMPNFLNSMSQIQKTAFYSQGSAD